MSKTATVDRSTPKARRANPLPGLSGKALETWIETGKNTRVQSAEAGTARRRRSTRSSAQATDADRAIVERAAKLAPKTPTWPKQIERVRKALGSKDVLEVIGMTKKDLRAYAKGEKLDGEKLTGLRALSTKTADPYCSGRRLAAMLVALEEESKK